MTSLTTPHAVGFERQPVKAKYPIVEGTDVRMLAKLEDTNWWYRGRCNVLARQLRDMTIGLAIDVDAAAGGNRRLLQEHGWK